MGSDYTRNKHFILNYIEKTEAYKEFCNDIKSNSESFKDSIRWFNGVGYVDINLVNMFIDSLNEIIKEYDKKLGEHNEKS